MDRWADVDTITLIVGESKSIFKIHEADLFETSSFFDAVFNSDSVEVGCLERTMLLPDDDVEAFEGFVEWLYGRYFELPPRAANPRFMAPLKMFVLAEKYGVLDLKEIVTEKIFAAGKNLEEPPSVSEIAYIYEHTAHGSGMRKLFADWFSWNVDLAWYETAAARLVLRQHPEIAADFSVGLAKRFKNSVPDGANDPFMADTPDKYRDKEPKQDN